MAGLKQQVQALMQKGAFRQAVPLLESACKTEPGNATNWRLLGVCHAQCQDLPKAEFSFRKSLGCDDRVYEAHVGLAGILAKRNAWPEAVRHYRKALALKPDQALVCNDLAYCLQRMRLPDEAIDAYKESLALDPRQHLAHRNLGLLYEQLHQLDDARQHGELALEQAPGDVEAAILLAKLDARQNADSAAINRLRSLLQRRLKPFHEAAVNIELGKILDRAGKLDEAFDCLARGKKIFAGLHDITAEKTLAYRNNIDRFRDTFAATPPGRTGDATLAGDPLKLIFLVGFPRSGTTLTEQILEAHPRVTATHELPVLVDLTHFIDRILGRRFSYPQDVHSLNQQEINRLRRVYLETMHKGLHDNVAPDSYLLDKLPLNLIHLGLIVRLFPEARILVALRDPRDVCLSCYLQSFELNPAMSQFLSLKDTAGFYATVMGLWLHYRKTLGVEYFETRYEDLVENPERAARAMLGFIGLPWDSSVLSFYQQARQRRVYTPSYQAVTQPVYTHSAGKWRSYEALLTPILPGLEPFIREFGY